MRRLAEEKEHAFARGWDASKACLKHNIDGFLHSMGFKLINEEDAPDA